MEMEDFDIKAFLLELPPEERKEIEANVKLYGEQLASMEKVEHPEANKKVA